MLTVQENLELRGSLYEKDTRIVRRNLEEVTQILNIENLLSRQFRKLSGGQKRRCEIAKSLMNTPDILFLDENPAILIENALSPAKVIAVMADPDETNCTCCSAGLPAFPCYRQGRQNACLAARLTADSAMFPVRRSHPFSVHQRAQVLCRLCS